MFRLALDINATFQNPPDQQDLHNHSTPYMESTVPVCIKNSYIAVNISLNGPIYPSAQRIQRPLSPSVFLVINRKLMDQPFPLIFIYNAIVTSPLQRDLLYALRAFEQATNLLSDMYIRKFSQTIISTPIARTLGLYTTHFPRPTGPHIDLQCSLLGSAGADTSALKTAMSANVSKCIFLEYFTSSYHFTIQSAGSIQHGILQLGFQTMLIIRKSHLTLIN